MSLKKTMDHRAQDLDQQPVILSIHGMTCASCVSHVQEALKKVPGVTDASVNLATETARLTLRLNGIARQTLVTESVEAVVAAGYEAAPQEVSVDSSSQQQSDIRRQKDAFLAAALLSLPLVAPMVLSWFGKMWMPPAWVQLVLATQVQFILGARFYRSSWSSLRARRANMDLLVVLGTSAAYGLSVFLMARSASGLVAGPPSLYFESSSVVMTWVLLGKWLEARARYRTSEAIRSLQSLRPESARVIRQGTEIEVPWEFVELRDVVAVRPGERIPVDGCVIEGSSQVNESLITGESLPVSKTTGQNVTGGSMNGEGYLQIRTTAVGTETRLSQMVRWVEKAQSAKAPIERVVDRVCAIFVPALLGISLMTFALTLAWRGDWISALLHAVAVLVVACPCALGLATPTAIMVGMGVAAKRGILIQDAGALELAQSVTTVVFDKTGTLTEGRPRLVRLLPLVGTEASLFQDVAAVQIGSEHPLARAVLEEARVRSLSYIPVRSLRTHPGRGIEGRIGKRLIRIGTELWMKEQGFDLSPLDSSRGEMENLGQTLSFVVEVEPIPSLLGVLAFSDALKSSSAEAVAVLKKNGVSTMMLTGDTASSAASVAQTLGIKKFRAHVLPGEKVQIIEELKKQGQIVAMVGDGINDAPALASAQVGMALSTGTDIAMQAAGIVLMRGDPRLVAEAIEISKLTDRKIKQNLFWAFIYNIFGIPLAALGYLSPELAGAAMALSSVSVMVNSLLLQKASSHSQKS